MPESISQALENLFQTIEQQMLREQLSVSEATRIVENYLSRFPESTPVSQNMVRNRLHDIKDQVYENNDLKLKTQLTKNTAVRLDSLAIAQYQRLDKENQANGIFLIDDKFVSKPLTSVNRVYLDAQGITTKLQNSIISNTSIKFLIDCSDTKVKSVLGWEATNSYALSIYSDLDSESNDSTTRLNENSWMLLEYSGSQLNLRGNLKGPSFTDIQLRLDFFKNIFESIAKNTEKPILLTSEARNLQINQASTLEIYKLLGATLAQTTYQSKPIAELSIDTRNSLLIDLLNSEVSNFYIRTTLKDRKIAELRPIQDMLFKLLLKRDNLAAITYLRESGCQNYISASELYKLTYKDEKQFLNAVAEFKPELSEDSYSILFETLSTGKPEIFQKLWAALDEKPQLDFQQLFRLTFRLAAKKSESTLTLILDAFFDERHKASAAKLSLDEILKFVPVSSTAKRVWTIPRVLKLLAQKYPENISNQFLSNTLIRALKKLDHQVISALSTEFKKSNDAILTEYTDNQSIQEFVNEIEGSFLRNKTSTIFNFCDKLPSAELKALAVLAKKPLDEVVSSFKNSTSEPVNNMAEIIKIFALNLETAVISMPELQQVLKTLSATELSFLRSPEDLLKMSKILSKNHITSSKRL